MIGDFNVKTENQQRSNISKEAISKGGRHLKRIIEECKGKGTRGK